jgi:hypothetical protein
MSFLSISHVLAHIALGSHVREKKCKGKIQGRKNRKERMRREEKIGREGEVGRV